MRCRAPAKYLPCDATRTPTSCCRGEDRGGRRYQDCDRGEYASTERRVSARAEVSAEMAGITGVVKCFAIEQIRGLST